MDDSVPGGTRVRPSTDTRGATAIDYAMVVALVAATLVTLVAIVSG